ncbi:MAG: four helix bundle protein [Gemmatimonadales bacterium]
MGHYRDLRAWQVAHELAMAVSCSVEDFPPHERFELGSQLRRASLSVPTNLAEGQSLYGPKQALRYARIAAGSLGEVDYLLLVAKEKRYLDSTVYDRLLAKRKHASRLIAKLIRSLRTATLAHP